MENLPSIHPYMGISRDEARGKFRICISSAYNAFGLIGPEFNGIVVFDNEARAVVADRLFCETTGYFGPSRAQVAAFEKMLTCPPAEFCRIVNDSGRNRRAISPSEFTAKKAKNK
jgi:hypothetical protein